MKELLTNFFAYGFAISLDKLLAFLLIPIYASKLSVDEFGVIDLIQTIIGIVSIFAFLQLETSLQRYYFEYEGEKKKEYVFTIYISVIILSILLSVLIGLFSRILATHICGDANYFKYLIIAAIQIPFSCSATLSLIILRYEKKNKLFTFSILLRSILLMTFIFVFFYIIDWGMKGYFSASLLASCISSIITFLLIKNSFACSFRRKLLVKSLQYALPQVPARVGVIANTYANRFMILNYMTTYSIGIFSMALYIGSIMTLFESTFSMAWNQYLFRIVTEEKQKIMVVHMLEVVVPIIFMIALSIGLFSHEIIYYFADPKYIESSKYIACISFSISLLSVSTVMQTGPKVLSKTQYLSYSFFISCVTNLILLFLLTKEYQLLGVVWAMIIANSILVISSWYFSNKIYPIRFKLPLLLIEYVFGIMICSYLCFDDRELVCRIILEIVMIAFYLFLLWRAVNRYRRSC